MEAGLSRGLTEKPVLVQVQRCLSLLLRFSVGSPHGYASADLSLQTSESDPEGRTGSTSLLCSGALACVVEMCHETDLLLRLTFAVTIE